MALTVGMYSFDCTDAEALAGFWGEVTGKTVDPGASPAYATLDVDVGPTWMFVRVPDPPAGDNRVLLDLTADPYEDEVERVRAIEGVRALGSEEEDGVRWSVFCDLEGNRFRLFAPRPG